MKIRIRIKNSEIWISIKVKSQIRILIKVKFVGIQIRIKMMRIPNTAVPDSFAAFVYETIGQYWYLILKKHDNQAKFLYTVPYRYRTCIDTM
jgi:hypothetical protein